MGDEPSTLEQRVRFLAKRIDELENRENFSETERTELRGTVNDLKEFHDKHLFDIEDINYIRNSLEELTEEFRESGDQRFLDLQEKVNAWSKKVSKWTNTFSEAVNEGFTEHKKKDKEQNSKAQKLEQRLINTEQENKRLRRENKKINQDLRDLKENLERNEHMVKEVLRVLRK